MRIKSGKMLRNITERHPSEEFKSTLRPAQPTTVLHYSHKDPSIQCKYLLGGDGLVSNLQNDNNKK